MRVLFLVPAFAFVIALVGTQSNADDPSRSAVSGSDTIASRQERTTCEPNCGQDEGQDEVHRTIADDRPHIKALSCLLDGRCKAISGGENPVAFILPADLSAPMPVKEGSLSPGLSKVLDSIAEVLKLVDANFNLNLEFGDDINIIVFHVPMPPQSGSPTETSPPLVKPVIFTRFAQDVFFFSDEAEVGTRGLRLVQDLVQEFISRHAASEYLADIFVVGHTDNVGTEEYNMELSRKRASNLIQVFKGQFSRYSTAPRVYYDYIGVGESQPIKQYSKETESHQNRRAEIFFSDQAGTGKNAAAYLDCLRRYRSRPRNCLTHYQDLWKPLNASAANSP